MLHGAQARFRERQKAKQADTERRMAALEAELHRLQVLSLSRPPQSSHVSRVVVRTMNRPQLPDAECHPAALKASARYAVSHGCAVIEDPHVSNAVNEDPHVSNTKTSLFWERGWMSILIWSG